MSTEIKDDTTVADVARLFGAEPGDVRVIRELTPGEKLEAQREGVKRRVGVLKLLSAPTDGKTQ